MRWITALILAFLIFGCAQKGVEKLEVKSVFENGGFIPKKYTCDGDNINPPLILKNLDPKAKSIVVIVEDPDAPMGTFTHWIIYNIPPVSEIPEGIPRGKLIEKPFKAMQGKNDFGYYGYGGPCPPSGIHRYYFKVYVLDTVLDWKEYSKDELLKAIESHVIQYGEIMGKYSRS